MVSYCNGSALRATAALLLAFTCWLMVGAEELRICPKCGFEFSADSTKCQHCEASLPGQGAADPIRSPDGASGSGPSSHQFTEDGKLDSLAVETVNEEVQIARQCLGGGDPALARLYFRNAMALDRLVKADSDGDRLEALKKYIQQCNKLPAALQQVCPVCAGGTKSSLKVASMTGAGRRQDVSGRICPRCSGGKFIVTAQTIAQWREVGEKARSVFVGKQPARKFVSVGGAWVPKEVAGKLTVRQRAALAQVVLAECKDCSGLGFVDCAGCQGLGEVKCSAGGCELGQVTVESKGELVKGKIFRTEGCPTCKGSGASSCSDCKGAGKIKCGRCAGSGQAYACKKCGGNMLVECRKCKGAGTVKDHPCAECTGEGKLLCPVCASPNLR